MTERKLDHHQDHHDGKEARRSSISPRRPRQRKRTTNCLAEKTRCSPAETPFWAQHTEHGHQHQASVPSPCCPRRSGEPDSGAHLADMSQLQHADEDSLVSGDLQTYLSYNMLRKTHLSVETYRHIPATTCWGRLTCQWRPTDMSELQHAEEDSLVSGDLQTYPSYNMLRKTHLSVETYSHVPATTCWGRLTCRWRPTDMSELQHAEEDSLVSGDLQSCPSYNMLRKTHLSVETYRHVRATTCWGRLTCQWRPTDISQLQHAEEDSLVSGDLQTCPSYNMLRKTHLSMETYRHVRATTCWGRLTCRWRPTDMSELQHAEEDSLVSGDLQTCPSYNMLRKTHLSMETYRHVRATTCWGRLTCQWRPADISQLQHAEEDLFATGNYVKQNVHTQSPSTYFRSVSPFNIALVRIKLHTFRMCWFGRLLSLIYQYQSIRVRNEEQQQWIQTNYINPSWQTPAPYGSKLHIPHTIS